MNNVKRIRIRRREPSGMEKVGWVATAIASLVLLAVIGMVFVSMPEIKRYLKIESM
jgi:hypothetical protein